MWRVFFHMVFNVEAGRTVVCPPASVANLSCDLLVAACVWALRRAADWLWAAWLWAAWFWCATWFWRTARTWAWVAARIAIAAAAGQHQCSSSKYD